MDEAQTNGFAPGAGHVETGWWTRPLAPTAPVRLDGADAAPVMMNVADVARELRKSGKTIRRMDRAGKLPEPTRRNHSILWPRDEFLAWLAADQPDRNEWNVRKQPIAPRLTEISAERDERFGRTVACVAGNRR